ncbi:hypothetical protein PCANB_001280 [Pneumocystis canis]|nr:hypothetical protein PCK1_001301 [Pneumocystis canis]KAG5437004.1 hypothetical protein PCANB_001280 [Pneumocystis canis]
MNTQNVKPVPPVLPSNKNMNLSGNMQDISALLNQIQKGKTLKKTITNDRSAPIIRNVRSHETSNRVTSNRVISNQEKQQPAVQKLSELFVDGIPKLKHREGGVNTGAITTKNTENSQEERKFSQAKKSLVSNAPSIPNIHSAETSLPKNNISSRSVSDSPEISYRKTNSAVLMQSNHFPPSIPRTASLSTKKINTQIPAPLIPPPPPPPPTRNVSVPASIQMTSTPPPPPLPQTVISNKVNMRPPPPPPPQLLPSVTSVDAMKESRFEKTSPLAFSSQKFITKLQKPYISSNFKLYTGPGIKPSNANILIDDSRWKFKDEDEFPEPRTFSGEQKIFKSGRLGGSTVPLNLD